MSRVDPPGPPSNALSELSPEDVRRNTRLGILNGILGQVAIVFVHPELVFVVMIYALAGDALTKTALLYMAALVTVISKAGMLGPQLIVGALLEHRENKRPTYVLLMFLRAFAYGLMIAVVYLIGDDRVSVFLGLSVFFIAYLAVCICAGAGHGIYTDLLGRIIPIGRMGRFLGLRNFLGGVFGTAAGFLCIPAILGHIPLPVSYVVLITTGAVFSISAMIVFLRTRDPGGAHARERTTLMQSLRRGFAWIKVDHNYRCYFGLRAAFRINYLGLTFFVPYGILHLCRSGTMVEVIALTGIMVATERGSRLLSAFVWGKVADHRDFRTCLVGAGVAFLAMPVLALIVPYLRTLFELRIPYTDAMLTFPICVYLLALAAWGVAVQASIIAGNRFYIGSAPPHRRISYMGFLNTATSPLTLLPFAGAALAARFGVGIIFLIVIGGSLLYLLDAVRMIPEHKAVAERDGEMVDAFTITGSQ